MYFIMSSVIGSGAASCAADPMTRERAGFRQRREKKFRGDATSAPPPHGARSPNLTPPALRQGYRIWQGRAFLPLPSGRGRDPARQRWEGEGELPSPRLLQETTRNLRAPLTLPRLLRGSLPLPH